MRPVRSHRLRVVAAIAVACLLAACVYRLDTQQGNLLDQDQVDAVATGMTRSQVRFLLGTPMVADPFSQDRWDYVYYFRRGSTGATRSSHVIVWFDGDIVTRIERPETIKPKNAAKAS
jgi:outer membrane protein assembly factor BamE